MMRKMTDTQASVTKIIAIIATLLLSLLQQGLAHYVAVKELVVPKHVQRFTNVSLSCLYESEEIPFLIKWAHNNLEFAKYEFGLDYPLTLYDDVAIKVIEELTTNETIVLKEVDLSASGNYTCTVIGDVPHFVEANMTKTMIVVVVPDEQPRIEGDVQAHYSVGDIVNLTCTAPPSIPAATLSWDINEQKAPTEYVKEHPVKTNQDGLYVTKLQLNFELSQSHFIKGELKLKCVASISTLYLESNEHSQQESPVKDKDVATLPEEESLVTIDPGTAGGVSVLGSFSTTVVLPVTVMLLSCIHLLH